MNVLISDLVNMLTDRQGPSGAPGRHEAGQDM